MHPHARALKAQLRPRLVERWSPEEIANIHANQSRYGAATPAVTTSAKAPHAPATPSKAPTGLVGPPLQNTVVKPSTSTAVAPVAPAKPTTTSVAPVSTIQRVVPTTTVEPSDEIDDEPSTVNSPTRATTTSTTTANRIVGTPLTRTAAASSSSTLSVKFVTSDPLHTSDRNLASSSSLTSGTALSAANSSTSSGMSGGAVAGIVIAVLLGLSAAGAFVVYFMKRNKERSHSASDGWAKMDDDVTPFPSQSEKPASGGYYGAAAATGAGAGAMAYNQSQSRGLVVPDNGYDNRPMSDMGAENFAGYGAGRVYGNQPSAVAPVATYGINQAYSDHMNSPPHAMSTPQPDHSAYYRQPPQGFDEYGMPYHPQQQQHNPFEDSPLSPTHAAASGPRQLVGPGQQYAPQPYGLAIGAPAPVPLGRPEAPNSYDDIAAAEMYADDRYADDHMAAPAAYGHPSPAPVQRYTDSDPTYSPHAAPHQDQHWPNEKELYAAAAMQAQTSNVLPGPNAASSSAAAAPMVASAPVPYKDSPASERHALPQSVPLPQLDPMSPFMDPISLHDTNQPSTHDLLDDDETMAMYADVAAAAGIPMSAQPYQHGQPLTPLREVPTPLPETRPLPSTPATPETPSNPAVPTAKAPLPAIPSSSSSAPSTSTAPTTGPTRLPPAPAQDLDDVYGGI